MTTTTFVDTLRAALADLEARVERRRGVTPAAPWVIELEAGLYLAEDNGTFHGAGITHHGLAFYTPHHIDGAVRYLRDETKGAYRGARKVIYAEALEAWRDTLAGLIKSLEHLTA